MTRVAERSEEQKARDRASNRESSRRRRVRLRAAHAAGLIDVPREKKCGCCKELRLAVEFSKTVNAHDGLYAYCRECDKSLQKARTEQYRTEDPEGWKRRRAAAVRKYRYGVTDSEYSLLAEAQEYGCAICGQGDQSEDLCVDHNHATGEVRGLLCKKCNSGIGLLGDDPARIAAALAYILKEG